MTTYARTCVHVQEREHIVRSRHTVVGIESRLPAGQPRNTGRCKRFDSTPKRADRLWGRRSLLFSGCQYSLLGIERQERVLIIHLSMVLRLKIRGPIPPRLLTFLWYMYT